MKWKFLDYCFWHGRHHTMNMDIRHNSVSQDLGGQISQLHGQCDYIETPRLI